MFQHLFVLMSTCLDTFGFRVGKFNMTRGQGLSWGRGSQMLRAEGPVFLSLFFEKVIAARILLHGLLSQFKLGVSSLGLSS